MVYFHFYLYSIPQCRLFRKARFGKKQLHCAELCGIMAQSIRFRPGKEGFLMKLWNRIFVLLTVIALLVVCTACGSKDVQDTTGEGASTPSIVAPGKEDSGEDTPANSADSKEDAPANSDAPAGTTEADSEEDLG